VQGVECSNHSVPTIDPPLPPPQAVQSRIFPERINRSSSAMAANAT
jgi:hypothetical protein